MRRLQTVVKRLSVPLVAGSRPTVRLRSRSAKADPVSVRYGRSGLPTWSWESQSDRQPTGRMSMEAVLWMVLVTLMLVAGGVLVLALVTRVAARARRS